jgi:hypothetical protein
MASCAPVGNRRLLFARVQAGYQPAAGCEPAPPRPDYCCRRPVFRHSSKAAIHVSVLTFVLPASTWSFPRSTRSLSSRARRASSAIRDSSAIDPAPPHSSFDTRKVSKSASEPDNARRTVVAAKVSEPSSRRAAMFERIARRSSLHMSPIAGDRVKIRPVGRNRRCRRTGRFRRALARAEISRTGPPRPRLRRWVRPEFSCAAVET